MKPDFRLFRLLTLAGAFVSAGGVASAPVLAAKPDPSPTPATTPVEASVDVAAYVRKGRFDSVQISPDGSHIAATVAKDDHEMLVIMRRSDKKLVARKTTARGSYFNQFQWVAPDMVLAEVVEKKGRFGLLYYSRVLTLSTDSLSVLLWTPTTGTRPVLLDELPNDDDHILLAYNRIDGDLRGRKGSYVERVNYRTGTRKLEVRAPEDEASFMTDGSGMVRFAIGYAANGSRSYYLRDTADSDWVRVGRVHARDALRQWPIGFTRDGKGVLLQVEMPSGPDAIQTLDFATGERRPLLRDTVADPDGFVFDQGIPVGAVFRDAKPRTVFFDETSPLARQQRVLEKAFPDSVVDFTSRTSDGRLALAYVWSDRNPGDFYQFDVRTMRADYMLSRREWFDPDRMGAMRPITLAARDGMRLQGFVTVPAGSGGKPLPMVVMPHGGPFSVQDLWGFNDDVQVLADAGYAVLQVNFRGSDGRGQAFGKAGARQWGQAMQDDLTDATRWAIAQGIADPARICLFGASYGGYAALMGVAREPDLYQCAAGYVGVYDLPMLYTKGDIDGRSGREFLREWVGDKEVLGAVSPAQLADRIRVPVFLAAGGLDERAPIEHSRVMASALTSTGGQVETLYYEDEGHGFVQPAHQIEFYTRLLDFLARSLGGRRAGTANDATAAAD